MDLARYILRMGHGWNWTKIVSKRCLGCYRHRIFGFCHQCQFLTYHKTALRICFTNLNSHCLIYQAIWKICGSHSGRVLLSSAVPYRMVQIYWRFGGTYSSIFGIEARIQQCLTLIALLLEPENGGIMFFRTVGGLQASRRSDDIALKFISSLLSEAWW